MRYREDSPKIRFGTKDHTLCLYNIKSQLISIKPQTKNLRSELIALVKAVTDLEE